MSSPTSMVAQVPAGGTNNAKYYVSVTATWNGDAYQSCDANGNGAPDSNGNVVPACSSEGAPQYTY